jgi:serine/threonine protein kinase
MALTGGSRLGPYDITAQIGAGGMGEVYRAADTRLGREVAIKVLPPHVTGDAERVARFTQEARAAASLNHPHILALYDIGSEGGTPYLVTELLEGRTLRDALSEGALSLRKAVDYATQAARGLAAAHAKGIVHRDLKPENLFITSDDRLKILDFGLAKLTERETVDASALPTTPPATLPGVVLGTIGYMAPEQVRGLASDRRSDIFALGAVLYEMVAGQRAFQGDTAMDTMTAILKEEPAEVPATRPVTPALARIVRRCLEKNPAMRFQSADDLAFALEGISSAERVQSSLPAVPPAGRRRWLGAAAAVVVVALVAMALAIDGRSRPAANSPVYWTSILPPDGVTIGDVSGNVPSRRIALSSDGRQLAFTATDAKGRLQLWIRSLESSAARPLDGTDNATYPFWSPDSRHIGFFVEGSGNAKLKVLDLAAGSQTTLSGRAPAHVSDNRQGHARGSVGRAGRWRSDATTVPADTGERDLGTLFTGRAMGGLRVG